MELNDKQLQEIEDFASKYMDKEEVRLILQLDKAADLSSADTPEGAAFLRGRLRRKAQFNFNIMQLSDQLSSPAQAIELKLAEKAALNDKKRR